MSELLAGVARTIITPPMGTYLIGYGDRTRGCNSVHDDLGATALVLDDGDTRLALIALDMLFDRQRNPSFKRILGEVRDRVKAGEELSEAFTGYEGIFPPIYSSTLMAGERSGELEQVIRRYQLPAMAARSMSLPQQLSGADCRDLR